MAVSLLSGAAAAFDFVPCVADELQALGLAVSVLGADLAFPGTQYLQTILVAEAPVAHDIEWGAVVTDRIVDDVFEQFFLGHRVGASREIRTVRRGREPGR